MRHYLDLNLSELIDYNKKNRHDLVESDLAAEHRLFVLIYEDFLLGDTEKLSLYQEQVLASQSVGLQINYQLKLIIRNNQYTGADLDYFIKRHQIENDMFFKAEMAFSIARIYENLLDWTRSSAWYERAGVEFADLKCYFKSQKCALNSLCSLYNVNQDYQLVYKYEILLKQTLDLKNFDTAVMVANNISRIYLARNANQTAMKYNDLALQYSLQTTLLNQHLIKLHQVKIHIALENIEQIGQLVEELHLSPFPQVVNSMKLILQHKTTELPSDLPESDRVSLSKEYKLSKSEGIIYELLLEKQRASLDDVINLLFGQKIDHDSAMNRLGNLLFRVRKKTNLRIEIKDQDVVLIK